MSKEEELELKVRKANADYRKTCTDIIQLNDIDKDNVNSYLKFIATKLISIEAELRYLRNRL